jgi:hypothetical protein
LSADQLAKISSVLYREYLQQLPPDTTPCNRSTFRHRFYLARGKQGVEGERQLDKYGSNLSKTFLEEIMIQNPQELQKNATELHTKFLKWCEDRGTPAPNTKLSTFNNQLTATRKKLLK